MIDILIYENQKYHIENTFKFINIVDYSGLLNITYYATSQELSSLDELRQYKLIVVDIDLSAKSEKDGIAIIREIKDFDPLMLSKIFIITGSTRISHKMADLGLKDIPIVKKPANRDEILKIMLKIVPKAQ